jgi:DNA-binding MarR family transcriptional regulator
MAQDKKTNQSMNKIIENGSCSMVHAKNTIGFQLIKILKLKRRFVDIEMNELGLSRTAWRVLFWMNILGACSQKELLKNLEIDAGHLSRVLEGFEKKGYIVRTPIQGNRRSLFIQMTEYGKLFLMPHMQLAINKEDAILLNEINEQDRKLLFKLLNQLEANMQVALKEYNTRDRIHHE